jgi:[ribosomal protein S18]-alanine N-acetyltransferase
MGSGDLPAVLAIERAAYPYPWTGAIFQDCLRVGYCCWVAEDASGVIGYFVLSVAAQEAHLLNLCITPQLQRQGLGRRLLRQVLRLAREHDARSLFLEVRPSNTAALVLYRGTGFTEIGVRRAYYPADDGGRENAVVLSLSL